MRLGGRIPALSKTVQQTTEWATKLEKDGISLRFLNNIQDNNSRYNNLTLPKEVDNLIIKTQFAGRTQLGTVLRKKVIQPLEDKANNTGGRVKPRIIMIITDGAVRGFPPQIVIFVMAHVSM
jgi:hypothetical protein